MPDESTGTRAAGRDGRRTLTEMYGHAYLKAEESGGRPGAAYLIYQLQNGVAFAEDVANYFAPPELWWPTDVLACKQVSGRVLDIGCGAGRHALAVAEAGHETVAIEPSSVAVAVSRRRGVDARIGGLGQLPDDIGTFDTFLLAGGGLHLLGVLDNARDALAELTKIANPGARLIGTTLLLEEDEFAAGEGDPDPGRALYRLRVEQGAEFTEWSEWGYTAEVRPERLAEVVAGTGWTIAEIEEAESPAMPVFPAQTGAGKAGESVIEGTDSPSLFTTYVAVLRLETP
ncbi:hypothetical protein GCM10012275_04480 [Longimycelium tulufanense]|uniref:Methyltransferase domain-containing protein n=1 Tax=Longimycelium tulufanense TaxID=907463 RepID=A0A8J3FUM2_9PSEU|nr:class I SAM-dependent methyltransferase [Longimycelium tulufanense]GGM36325.1 hypothetical protein GCM10012275_04480 [Longimycelium tulufanense]